MFTEGVEKTVQGSQATSFIKKKPTRFNCRTQPTKALPAPGSLAGRSPKCDKITIKKKIKN